MKHLAFALLTLIVLGGCATGGLYRGYVLDSSDDDLLTLLYEDSSINVVNETFEIPDNFIFIKFNLLNNEDSFLEAYVSPRTFEKRRDYLGGIYGLWIVSALRISKACKEYSGD